MSIEQTQTVDFVNIDRVSGDVVLAISDHLSWEEDEGDHLVLLQDKLNTYLRFIESGELVTKFPGAKGRDIVISLVGQFPMSQTAQKFFTMASDAIAAAGFTLRFSILRVD